MRGFERDNRIEDIRIATAFLTRLPLLLKQAPGPGRLARASWAFPVVGVLAGIAGGMVYGIAVWFGLPPLLAAIFAVGGQILLTGALHEDAAGDVADGLGGGATRESRLEIMRDSRVGAYGVLALILVVGARVAALSALTETTAVIAALIAAGALSRAAMVAVMEMLPPARHEGLGAHAGQPGKPNVVIALAIGGGAAFLAVVFFTGLNGFIGAVAGAIIGAGGIAWIARRRIGGQTGDVLGASQQAAEVLCLAAIVAGL